MEAASALDVETERRVQHQIDSYHAPVVNVKPEVM